MASKHRATQKETEGDSQPVRRRGVAAVATDVRVLGAHAFARAGFTDPALILHWATIAGPEVARLAQPIRLVEGPSGGTLTLRAVPGAALFLAHEKRALCERVNAYLGRPAVTRIIFRQGAPMSAPPPPEKQKPARPLPPSDPSRRYLGPEGLARALQALARRRVP
jgi:hypothetical protein